MKSLAMALGIGTILTTAVLADDAEDVKAAELAHFAAQNAGDVDGWVMHHMPRKSTFAATGGFFYRYDSLEQQRENRQKQIVAGMKINLRLEHLEVEVYNETALTTSYVVGTVTDPDGTIRPISWRRSTVLIKREGRWREVHGHTSPFTPANQ